MTTSSSHQWILQKGRGDPEDEGGFNRAAPGMAPKTPKLGGNHGALPVGNEGMKLYMVMMGMKLNPGSPY